MGKIEGPQGKASDLFDKIWTENILREVEHLQDERTDTADTTKRSDDCSDTLKAKIRSGKSSDTIKA